jgi:hypothetical protein
MAIVRYTWEELQQLPDLTDWEGLKNMRDEDIDLTDPDNPEWTDEDFACATRYGKSLHKTAKKKQKHELVYA